MCILWLKRCNLISVLLGDPKAAGSWLEVVAKEGSVQFSFPEGFNRKRENWQNSNVALRL